MTKEKKLVPQERHYEKVNLEEYNEFAAMIDRMFFKLTGKTSNRTPEEEAEMRGKFEEMKAKKAKKAADALKKKTD
jgi:hypothetical protein